MPDKAYTSGNFYIDRDNTPLEKTPGDNAVATYINTNLLLAVTVANTLVEELEFIGAYKPHSGKAPPIAHFRFVDVGHYVYTDGAGIEYGFVRDTITAPWQAEVPEVPSGWLNASQITAKANAVKAAVEHGTTH